MNSRLPELLLHPVITTASTNTKTNNNLFTPHLYAKAVHCTS